MYDFQWKRIVLTAVWIGLSATAANAQGPTISLPGGSIYKAGPDYASDVLQDPWDFSNIEDLSPDPNEFGGWVSPAPETVGMNGTGQSFLSPDGWMRGVAAGDTRMSLLHRTFADTLKPGRTGATYPIDPTAYRKMAVKMRVTGAAIADNLAVYWWHRFIVEGPDWTERGGSAFLSPQIPAGTGTSQHIYVVDLATATPLRGPFDPYITGPIKALHIDPTSTPGQKTVEIDWVRLTAADNDPNASLIPVNLQGCTWFQHVTVTDTDGFSTRIDDAVGNDNSRTFNAGIFPPGNYNVTVTCGNGSATANFWINAPPQVTVLDPDEKGDLATDWALMNGDPWDFEQPTDVDRITNVTFSQGPCATVPCGLVPTQFPGTGLMFRGSSWGAPGSQLGDPALGILEGAIVPINSLKHRILSFSLQIQRPYNLGLGSVARFFWGSAATPDGLSVTGTEDMLAFPGPQTYTIDLATLSTANGGIETGCPGCLTLPWTARAIRHFRIDPHEFGDVPTGFDIDDVTLTAPDAVAVGQSFSVRFAFADLDSGGSGSSYTARIYAQRWPERTPDGRTELGTMPGIVPGQHTFSFQPLNPGEYRISVEVIEQRPGMMTQTSRAFSTGMVVVTNPAASTPKLSVSYPQPNQAVGLPLTIQGCAYDDGPGATGGINVDDIAISMRAIAGPRTGMTIPLGFEPTGPHTGLLQFGPLGTAVPCPSGVGPYANAGFRVAGIGAGLGDWMNGTWLLDVRARSTISGEMVQLAAFPFVIGPAPPPAPQNFQASAQGNTVFVSWGPPPGGAASYQIQVSNSPGFETLLHSLNVPQAGQYNGNLPSGTYYIRLYARSAAGAWSSPSPTVRVDVALPTAPGAPTLVATQVSANPVTVNWSPGPGGAPAAYTIHAGTSPGASNLLVAPMGLATGVTAVAPVGVPLYVRVVASNGAGQAVSNEISFVLAPPNPPTLNPAVVTGNAVALSWTPPTGGVPASYTILARYPSSAAIIARLPVAGTTVTVNAVPPGIYVVTMVSHNGQGTSAESAPITVTVP